MLAETPRPRRRRLRWNPSPADQPQVSGVESMVGFVHQHRSPSECASIPRESLAALCIRVQRRNRRGCPITHHVGLSHITSAVGAAASFDTLTVFRVVSRRPAVDSPPAPTSPECTFSTSTTPRNARALSTGNRRLCGRRGDCGSNSSISRESWAITTSTRSRRPVCLRTPRADHRTTGSAAGETCV